MEASRFARALAPLAAIALLGPPGMARPPAAGTADSPWDPPACRGGIAAAPASAPAAWFRLDALLDAAGTLAAQRLTIGVVGGPARSIDLPPESFASGPVRGVVLVGDDDGTRSRLRAIDPARGCATTVAVEAAVIRSGLLTSDLGAAFEHRVERRTREDLGVWRRPTRGGTSVRLLPGLAPDERHGRTFATDLRFAPDGRLAVASCGELACRTRLVDPATGLFDATAGTGPVLGVADGRVIAYDTCPGYPCDVVAVDPRSGATDRLVVDAGPAALAGSSLVFGHNGRLVTLELRTHIRTDVPTSEGLTPIDGGSSARAGFDLAGGSVMVAVAGHAPDPTTVRRLDTASDVIEPAVEVQP